MDIKKIKTLFALHILLMVYSTSGIFSKLAAQETFLSFKFCLFYGAVIALLGIYAFFLATDYKTAAADNGVCQ